MINKTRRARNLNDFQIVSWKRDEFFLLKAFIIIRILKIRITSLRYYSLSKISNELTHSTIFQNFQCYWLKHKIF